MCEKVPLWQWNHTHTQIQASHNSYGRKIKCEMCFSYFRFACPLRFVCLFVCSSVVCSFILGLGNCTVSSKRFIVMIIFFSMAKLCHKFQMFCSSLSILVCPFSYLFVLCTQCVCVYKCVHSIFRIHSDILSCGWHFFECSINSNSNNLSYK